ncbi:MAG: Hpt domain-containing protein [Bryobacteraceae bacterium]|jgi:HPt (histidine-containing phosphotransfer) domain-containing protein
MFDEQGAAARILVHPPEDLPYKVVVAYLDKCRQGVQAFKDGIERFDFDFAGMYGHRMKGSGGAYGFPQLSEIGASIEEAADARNGNALRNCATTLEAHLDSVEVVEI